MKTILHYRDGSKWEYSSYWVDGYVSWETNTLSLIKEDFTKPLKLDIDKELLYVEQKDPACGYYSIWHRPDEVMSIHTDVMTAKQRSKKNRDMWDYTYNITSTYNLHR